MGAVGDGALPPPHLEAALATAAAMTGSTILRPAVNHRTLFATEFLKLSSCRIESLKCRGGPYWNCYMSKWGDEVVACQKYCGLMFGLNWKRTLFWDCKWKNKLPDTEGMECSQSKGGLPKRPPIPPIPGMDQAEKGKGGKGKGKGQIQPWRGWPYKTIEPEYSRRMICCESPMPGCIDVSGRNVSLLEAPPAWLVPPLPLVMHRPQTVEGSSAFSANRPRRRRRAASDGAVGMAYTWSCFLDPKDFPGKGPVDQQRVSMTHGMGKGHGGGVAATRIRNIRGKGCATENVDRRYGKGPLSPHASCRLPPLGEAAACSNLSASSSDKSSRCSSPSTGLQLSRSLLVTPAEPCTRGGQCHPCAKFSADIVISSALAGVGSQALSAQCGLGGVHRCSSAASSTGAGDSSVAGGHNTARTSIRRRRRPHRRHFGPRRRSPLAAFL